MLPIHFNDIFHPFRTFDLLSWWWYHKRGTWEHLVDTNRKRALELEWWRHFDYKLNLKHPKTFNEKVQWLEAFSDTSLWTKYADKHEVRKYIAECGYADSLLQEYGVWDKVEDIDFDALPNSFAIKCTHDMGSTMLIKDKSSDFDKDSIVRSLRWRLKLTYGYETVEPHYTKIPHRIMAEELLPQLHDDGNMISEAGTIDYKFICFDGKTQFVLVCYDRNIKSHVSIREIYDIDTWTPLRDVCIERFSHQDYHPIPRPENLQKMVEMAERLSKGFPEVRVDLYNINGKIYFGELTFTWYGGRINWLTDEFQLKLGSEIQLPDLKR